MKNVFRNFDQQVVKKKELIIVLNRDDMDIGIWREKAEKYPNVSVYQLPGAASVGHCKNFAIAKAKYDVIAKFDDDDYYAPDYLMEALNTLKRTNADVIGKTTYYSYVERYRSLIIKNEQNENRFVQLVNDATLVFKKQIFNKVRFTDMCTGSDKEFQKECRRKGFKIYSTSKRNFVYIRRNPMYHTWKISEKQFMKGSRFVCYTDDFENIIEKGR